MPKLNRELIRAWLVDHNWSVGRLAQECSALGEDTIPAGVMRNAVNGIDPMRPGRINLIRRVTEKYGDGILYERLVAAEEGQNGQRGGQVPRPKPRGDLAPGVRREVAGRADVRQPDP